MKAIGYCRVSTEGQARDGVSLEAQQAKIRVWCQASGCELIGMFVDAGLSGNRSDNRPGLQQGLTQACKHKAAFVVYSLSRLARSTKDALAISERLDKSGADLVAERTKSALGHLRNQGKRISGKIPYGYDLSADGGSLIPNPSEQEGVRFMLGQRAAGHGRRKIAAALTAHGFPTKTGVSWSPQAVGSILRRETLLESSVTHVAA